MRSTARLGGLSARPLSRLPVSPQTHDFRTITVSTEETEAQGVQCLVHTVPSSGAEPHLKSRGLDAYTQAEHSTLWDRSLWP